MLKLLHFADAHIDMANYGRQDPETGLPVRVMDFLKSLDVIVDAAIAEKVDLVIFAGDAYKDRNPQPTFQREWGRRIMRLSQAGVPTLLLVGNHDLSPALNRAHALDPFDTLAVPRVRVLDKPAFLNPDDLGLPLQVIAIPWITRSGILAYLDITASNPDEIYALLEERVTELVRGWLDEADPKIPIVLTAHASIQGAKYGGERTVMLGRDVVLPGSLVKDPRLDYVAMGHIHKPQDLNEGSHPPVIYPGSIERVDFGEATEDKFYVIAEVKRGKTKVKWHKLDHIRPFVDRFVRIETDEDVMDQILGKLPEPDALAETIFRLTLEYPRAYEALIDDGALRTHAAGCFEFRLIKRPQFKDRVRLPDDEGIGSLSPLELLELYWKASATAEEEIPGLQELAEGIMDGDEK
ncbi:MAG TPA: exonuclease SbcCD subunit D [Anaerolineales bacterium]|nr:exonuclease SbcCD subunit D [Anaerolineales bacterium]